LRLTDADNTWRDDNAAYFDEVFPIRDAPVGSPGGAAQIGRLEVDAPLAHAHRLHVAAKLTSPVETQ
jgi:hypothetical protein